MFRISIAILLTISVAANAQHRGLSYELINEIGTHKLTSLTFSHRIDNQEGYSFVTDKTGKDTLYHFNQFLNGYVGLSNDGSTVVHVQSEQLSKPLDNLTVTLFKDGKLVKAGNLPKLLKYELDDAKQRQALPKSGWLRNDSLLHTMASNSFYVTDDKVFISTDGPLLHVFNLNQAFLVYTGNGANHFHQNYYAIPNLPIRTELSSSEYFPKNIPSTINGREFSKILSSASKLEIAIPETAIYRVDVDLFVNQSGNSEPRGIKVYDTKTNSVNDALTKELIGNLPSLQFQTSTIPPEHPGWIFNETFWLK